MEKYTLTYKGYYKLLLELVKLDDEFNLTVEKIKVNEITIEIIDLEKDIELIFDRQKEIYDIVDNSNLVIDKELLEMTRKQLILIIIKFVLAIILLITIRYSDVNINTLIFTLAGFITIVKFTTKGIRDLLEIILNKCIKLIRKEI